MKRYVIATSMRTGSTMLCDYLRECGAGDPDEHFTLAPHRNWTEQQYRKRLHDLESEAFATGYLGTKIFAYQLHGQPVLQDIWGDYFPPTETTYIHLIRRDQIAQAVSAAMAHQTERFHHWQEVRRQTTYNHAAIELYLQRIVWSGRFWGEWFFMRGASPTVLVYEDLPLDTGLRWAAMVLGVPSVPIADAIKTERFDSELKDGWAEEFTRWYTEEWLR